MCVHSSTCVSGGPVHMQLNLHKLTCVPMCMHSGLPLAQVKPRMHPCCTTTHGARFRIGHGWQNDVRFLFLNLDNTRFDFVNGSSRHEYCDAFQLD